MLQPPGPRPPDHAGVPPAAPQKSVPSKSSPQERFNESVQKQQDELKTHPLVLPVNQEGLHQEVVVIKGSLVIKPGEHRGRIGELCHQVLEIVGLQDTVPRASTIIASKINPQDKAKYAIIDGPDNKPYAVKEDEVCESYLLTCGKRMINIGENEHPFVVRAGKEKDTARAEMLTFTTFEDIQGDTYVVPSNLMTTHKEKPEEKKGYTYLENDKGWHEIPEELAIKIEEDDEEATCTLLEMEYLLRLDEQGNWSLDIEPDDLTDMASSDNTLWYIGDNEFVLKSTLEPVIEDEKGNTFVERGGVRYPIDDTIQNATNVLCLVQEKIESVPGCEVKPNNTAFLQQVQYDALTDSVLSMVLLCPQDSKVTDSDTNFLPVAHPERGIAMVFIDTDEAFPTNNALSNSTDHSSKDIAVLRPGLLAFDKTAVPLAGGDLSYALQHMQNIVGKKQEILNCVKSTLHQAQIDALSERIDRIEMFLQEHKTKPFSLEDIVFFVFPKVKKDWHDFQQQKLKRDVIAERVGSTTVAEMQSRFHR